MTVEWPDYLQILADELGKYPDAKLTLTERLGIAWLRE